MRLMLHTLKKDARRLWPAAVLTWVLLAVLADLDRGRADRMASPIEGWLNLLLPLVWACLIALAVLEEPLVGDRNFWTTRPYSRASLLAAKVAFAVLVIHIPGVLADAFILAAHGFSPVIFAPELLRKQVDVLVAVTLPALALATLVRSFVHFIMILFGIAAGLAVLNGGWLRFPEFPLVAALRHGLTGAVLAAAAVAVVAIQYAKRRTWTARVVAMAAALIAALMWTLVPVRAEYAVGGMNPAPIITRRDAAPDETVSRSAGAGAPNSRVVLIPISVQMPRDASRAVVPLIEAEVTAPGGARIRSVRPTPNRPFERIPLLAFPFWAPDRSVEWFTLRFSAREWEKVKGQRVNVRGSAALQFYSPGPPTDLPFKGSRDVPGLGHCTSSVADDRNFDEIVKILCESPRDLQPANVFLRHETSGRVWRDSLNSSLTFVAGPTNTWLSPLRRGQTFFRLADRAATTAPGAQYLVPKEYLDSVRITIAPEIPWGHALAPFEFPSVEMVAR